MVEVVVPKWGLTTEQYVLVAWQCRVGDRVSSDDPIVTLEADKVDGDVFSPAAGVVEALLVAEGAEVEPGQVIAQIRTT